VQLSLTTESTAGVAGAGKPRQTEVLELSRADLEAVVRRMDDAAKALRGIDGAGVALGAVASAQGV